MKVSTQELSKIRIEEHTLALKYLGVQSMHSLSMQDGFVHTTDDSLKQLVSIIRSLKPEVILTHAKHDNHPDHPALAELVIRAVLKASLSTFLQPGEEKWRTPVILGVEGYLPIQPSVVVEVSDSIEWKKTLVAMYKSQHSKKLLQAMESIGIRNSLAYPKSESIEQFEVFSELPLLLSIF